MTTPFSAAPQALGYYYQIRYALYLLVCGYPGFKLSLERTDDIAIKSESELDALFQMKHHMNQEPLTNTHKDLWKTILVWSTHLVEGRVSLDNTQLLLVTNAPTSPNSIPNLLTTKNRDTSAALEKMKDVGSKSTDQSLRKAFDKFRSLTSDQQETLVGAIHVLDLAPDVEAIEDAIKNELIGVLPEHRGLVMQWIEGWWIEKAIKHLKSNADEYIDALDVQRVIAERAGLIPHGLLPHRHQNVRLDPVPAENVPLYVKQLIRIGITTIGINNAKRDYIRAFKERSDWVHHKLLFSEDLEEYNNKLVDEWENLLGLIDSDFSLEHGVSVSEASEHDCRMFGQRLYSRVCELDLKLRAFSVERYVIRGSYHMLADMNPPIVWWHPNSRIILEELLTSA